MAEAHATHRYTSPAMAAHWLVALLIFVGFGLGQFMTDLPTSPEKLQYYAWHKWLGVTVFLLAVLRVAWRVTHPVPALPADMPRWQRSSAHAAHIGLYLLMFLIPLSGWLFSSASGYQTIYLGVLPLPDLVGKSKALADTFKVTHVVLNNVLLFVVLLHFAAAAKHHWFERNGLMHRMIPASGGERGGPVLATGFGVLALSACLWLGFGVGEEEHEAPEAVASPVQVAAVAEDVAEADTAAPEAAVAAASAQAKGTLHARFTQLGVGVDVEFRRFAVDLSFDEAAPESGEVSVSVETASVDVGDESYNAELAGATWLGSEAHPMANFESTAMKAGADGGFIAEGNMTLKGVTQPVSIPFTVTAQGGERLFEGQFPISRKAYAIGDASWDEDLEDEVVIRFSVSVP